MTVPAKTFEPDVESDDPIANFVHTVCVHCLVQERRPLLTFCGRDASADVFVDPIDYGSHDCSMCVLAVATSDCPMCGRKADQ